jgi:hypothetical protein
MKHVCAYCGVEDSESWCPTLLGDYLKGKQEQCLTCWKKFFPPEEDEEEKE